jgi:uncharacterized membrane protein
LRMCVHRGEWPMVTFGNLQICWVLSHLEVLIRVEFVCVCVFIGVSVRVCVLSVCVVLCNSQNTKSTVLLLLAFDQWLVARVFLGELYLIG